MGVPWGRKNTVMPKFLAFSLTENTISLVHNLLTVVMGGAQETWWDVQYSQFRHRKHGIIGDPDSPHGLIHSNQG